MLRSISGTG